jgi:hypothetical protein
MFAFFIKVATLVSLVHNAIFVIYIVMLEFYTWLLKK